MMPPVHSRKARAAAVLLILLASSALVPLLTGYGPDGDAGRRTDDLFDAAVRRAADQMGDVAGTGEANPLLDQDAVDVPATFFHDRFDDEEQGGTNEDDRVGGFGNWTEGTGWHLDEFAAGKKVEYGYVPEECVNNETLGVDECTEQPVHERDSISQGYRFGDQDGYPLVGQARLDTPLINLQSLPVSVPPERRSVPGYDSARVQNLGTRQAEGAAGVSDETDLTFQNSRVPATGGPSDPGHIVLYIDHRFNLGYAPTPSPTGASTEDTVTNGFPWDGEYVERQTGQEDAGDAIRNASSTTGGAAREAIENTLPLLVNASDYASVFLEPEQGQVVPLQPLRAQLRAYDNTLQRHDGVAVFSGSQREFTEEAFDLTQWAGQDVILHFQVNTQNPSDPDAYFASDRFDQGAGFYGWDVSNVRVEGPAHRHNVRLDRVLYPDLDQGVTPARLGDKPFSFLLLNRGQVEEDVQMTMTADVFNETMDEKDPVECSVDVTLEEPGEAREVDMLAEGAGCLDIQPDWTYKVTVTATTARDQYLADNELRFTVKGQAPDIRLAERISASRSLVNREDTPILTITLHNAALDDQDVVLDLSAHWTPVGDKPTQEWVQGKNLTSAVYSKEVTVPAGEQLAVDWPVKPLQAGLYTVQVNASRPGPDGELFFPTASVTLGVLTAPEHAYRDSFDNIGKIRKAIWGGTEWSAESRVDVQPPCTVDVKLCPEDARYAKVLEMSDESLPQHTMVGLRGEFRPDPDRREVPIQNVQVKILHYAEDIRCLTAGSACNNMPQDALSVRIVDRQPMPQNQFFAQNIGFTNPGGSFHGNGAPGQWANTILNVGGPATRNAYYNGQWIAEDINLTAINLQYETGDPSKTVPGALRNQLAVNTIPAARLEDMALEFVMSSGSCPREHRACPLWRVAEIRVTAHPEDSEQAVMPLLVWSGMEPDEVHGNLFSYYVTRSDSASTVFYPSPIPFLGSFSGDELTPYTDDEDNEDHPLGGPRFPVVVEHDGNKTLRDSVTEQYDENGLGGLNATTHEVVNGTLNGTVWPQIDEDIGNELAVDDQFPCDLALPIPTTPVAPINNVLQSLQGQWNAVCAPYRQSIDYGNEDDHKRTPPNADDDWIALDGCKRDLQNETDRRFRCPTWELRDVGNLGGPSETTWHLDNGFYTHAQAAGSTSPYRYEDRADGTLEYLMSPVLEVPQVHGTKFQVQHSHRMHPYGAAEIPTYDNRATSPSFADSGMLMVRFLDAEGTDPTPFLPVQVDDNGGYTLMGCSYDDCDDDPLVVTPRPLGPEDGSGLNLGSLMIHDHRQVHTPGQAGNPARTVDLTRCVDGEPLLAGSGAQEEDEHACLVQFAFRLEVPPVPSDLEGARTTAREGGSEGWFIDGISISEEAAVPFALNVTGVEIETPGYDWTDLGFGPGGQAEAEITVRNAGVFPLSDSDVVFNVTLQHALDDSIRFHYEVRPEEGFSVPSHGQNSAHVTFDLPAAGPYVMAFCAFVVGELEDGVLLEDDPVDDCLVLEHSGADSDPQFHERDIAEIDDATNEHVLDLARLLGQTVVRVERNEKLEFDMDITPLQGRKSVDRTFPRQVFIEVNNTGNVVIHDAVLERTITPAKGSATTERWIIAESPVPGQTANWTEMILMDPDFPENHKDAKPYIYLDKAGVYFVTASIEGGCADCSQSIKLESFDTIYSNTFKPRGSGIHSDVGIRDPVQIDGAWRSTTGLGLEQDPTLPPVHMLQFGDPAIDQYPDNTDAAVSLPPTDLSNFRSSSLTITHKYDLEEGYDGARAEACIGEPEACDLADATWHVLEPTSHTEARRTLGRVAPHGPFVPDNDPTDRDLDRAFTGSSHARAPEAAGWVIDEFDLARLPGFARQVAFERFSEEGMVGAQGDQAFFPISDRNTTHPTWAIGAGSCPDDCWYRENIHKQNPPPLSKQDPEGYWWSGSTGATHSGDDRMAPASTPAGTTTLTTSVDVTDVTLPDRVRARAVFSYWKDVGGELYAYDPDLADLDDGEIRCGRENFRPHCERGGRTDAHWVDDGAAPVVDVVTDQGGRSTYNFAFRYDIEDTSGPGFFSGGYSNYDANRGAAVGYQRLEFYTTDAGDENVVACIDVLGQSCGDSAAPEDSFDVTTEVYPQQPSPVGWRQEAATATPEDWGIATVETRTEAMGNVWRFGHPIPGDEDGRTTYEPNARERLVSPRISLANVVGNEIELSYWEYEDMMWACKAGSGVYNTPLEMRVWVQPITPGPDGDIIGGWTRLQPDEDPSAHARGHEACNGHEQWRMRELDLSDYKGQDVRVGFEVETPRVALHPELDGTRRTNQALSVWRGGCCTDPDGFKWMIDEVTIAGGSMVGEPVQLRLRAGTDDSIHEGHWKVQELQLVGIKYQSNVAVLPDEPLVDRSIRRGGTMELSGQLRNLGREQDVRLQLAVDDADGLEVELCTRTCVHGTGIVTGGTETLYEVGQRGDRLDYHVDISFPDADRHYDFALRLVDSSGDPINDENIGDHERRFVVEADDQPGVLRSGLSADRPTVDRWETTTLRLDAWLDPSLSDGPATLTDDVEVTLNVTRLDGGDGVVSDITTEPVTVEVGPDGTTSLTWDWSTEQPGFYRFAAEVEGTGAFEGQGQFEGQDQEGVYTHVMVGMKPIYLQDDFSQDPFDNEWTQAADTGPSWTVSTTFSQTAGRSLFVGSTDGMYNPGTSIATTPPIRNFSWLVAEPEKGEQAIRDGSSVFAPRFAMAYQPRLFGDGSDDAVELRVLRENTQNPLRFADESSVMFRGSEQNDWRIATVPLHGDDADTRQGKLKDGSVTYNVLDGGNNSFAFVFAPPGPGQQGFAIDRVSVSSYDAVVEPPLQEADLQVGSEKTFYFRVENTGAARDTYTVDVSTSLHPLVDVEVIPAELVLEAGQTGFVAVQVNVPYENHFNGFGGYSLSVDIASTNDLTRVATGTVEFKNAGENLADFVTEVRRPAGDPDLVAGDQAMFIVDVRNDGPRTTLPTDVVLFACPEQELQACMDPDASPEPFEIGTRPLPALDFGESSSPTFSWILPVNTTGNQTIIAVADPEQIVPEYDPANSIGILPLPVAPLDWPELRVHDLRVLDAAGNDVRHAFARDHLTIEATLTNVGKADAEGVYFEIKNEWTLIDQGPGVLAPGDSVHLRTTWIAEAGNPLVIAKAEGDLPEQDLDNNKKEVRLTVQEGRLEARLDPPTLSLERGGDAEATLTLKNHRDRDVVLDLATVTSDPEILVQGLPGAVDVARGATVAIPLVIKTTPFVPSGQHDVRIDAVSGGDVVASVDLDALVDVHRAIRLTHPPVLATPGDAVVDLAFTNDGDAEETLVLELGAPDGWNATVLQPTLELEPGDGRTVRVLLDIPPGTLPGRHDLAIHAGELVNRIVPIEVTRQVAWRSTVETVSVASGRIDALVRVENVGNAAGTPWFFLDDAAVPLGVDPSPSDMQPGQARSYLLSLSATQSPPGLLLPGRDAPVPLEADRVARTEPLGLTGPAGDVRAGEPVLVQARVQNAESQAQSVPVRLWVDGALVDERYVVLEAGESRSVELRWVAALAGEHALTVTTGAGDETVGRTLVLEAAEPKDAGVPGPGVVAVALVLAAVGLARRRRQ